MNKSKNHILKAAFNFKNPITETTSDDMLTGVKRNFHPDYKMNVPAKKGIELSTNTAPMQSWVETQGATVITKGLNEYEVRKNVLEITLLRSTGIISNPQNPSRGTPAGPPISTPDLFMLGQNNANFAISFSDDSKQIKAYKQTFYGCTFGFFGEQKEQKLINIKNEFIDANFNNCLEARIWNGKSIQEI